ncbi:MAG: 50S ribosomal protein L6 [Anaerolineales bacterium]|nr:50S ribosomal protein L6 [Anaerolineales bacterium]MCB9127210.1 50S ribosomal protein L6 [Ardenticatenales bacterium]MCB9171966.1 50S ribosomal protein L6 [Ardenticatenales bacterium]
MSRIGKNPVRLPAGVEVKIEKGTVTVKGPKGTLSRDFPRNNGVAIALEEGSVVVTRQNDAKPTRAMHGTTRALIANMVTGVSEGYTKDLRVEGTGYRANQEGANLSLAVGLSHGVTFEPPEGVTFEVPKGNKQILIHGIDKESVGQIAAEIRAVRPPEPYKGKGIRYADEQIRRKAGKAGKAKK